MKWNHRHPSLLFGLALLSLVGLVLACTTDSPSEPRQDPAPPPGSGGGGGSFSVTVTVDPGSVPASSTDPVEVLVRVRNRNSGAPPATGATAVVVATLGTFNTPGTGPTSVVVTLVNGDARLLFFPGDTLGTAVIQAQFQGSLGQGLVTVQGGGAFFLSFVDPNVGKEGDVVTIHGGGFVQPVRVTFEGISARVRGVTPNQIRVEIPPAPSEVPRDTTLPVTVEVTIRIGTGDQASDSLASGFSFQPGSTSPQPVVLAVDPPGGPDAGNTRVTILGDNFVEPVRVIFTGSGGSAEGTVESVTATRIIVRTPPATALGVDNRGSLTAVTVINLDTGFEDTLTGAFQYGFIPLFLDNIDPSRGPQGGGTVVAINGTGFAIPLRVEIGTFVARVISVTPTQIVIETPAVTDDVFLTEPCNDNADEQEGTRLIPTAFDVTVTDITSGDSDTLANAFIYDPADSSCRNDVAPPPPPPPPPVASFTFTASGLTVIFDNTSTDFVSSQWSFGDGTVSAASDPTHTYAVAGTFVVTLTVRNSVGQADTTSQFVTVPPP